MKRQRALGVERVRIDSLTPFPGNPKQHATEALRESIRTHGQYRAVVISKDSVILAGHGTVEGMAAGAPDHGGLLLADAALDVPGAGRRGRPGAAAVRGAGAAPGPGRKAEHRDLSVESNKVAPFRNAPGCLTIRESSAQRLGPPGRHPREDHDSMTTTTVTATPVIMDAEGNPQGQTGPQETLGEFAEGTEIVLNLGLGHYAVKLKVGRTGAYGPTLETGRHKGLELIGVEWDYEETKIALPSGTRVAVL